MKYSVKVTYKLKPCYVDVEAESRDEAGRNAMRKAYHVISANLSPQIEDYSTEVEVQP